MRADRGKSLSAKQSSAPVIILHERSRRGGPREILILSNGCGRITNNWFSAAVTGEPRRFYFWNDSSKTFAAFDKFPLIRSQYEASAWALSDATAPSEDIKRPSAQTPIARRQRNLEPLKKVGTGTMLGHQITKYRRVLSSFGGRTSLYEIWVFSNPPNQKGIFDLYSRLFTYSCDLGFPLKEYFILTEGDKILRRRLTCEVVKIEKLDKSDPSLLLPNTKYRRVNDLFSVICGEDRSEMEMLFRNR